MLRHLLTLGSICTLAMACSSEPNEDEKLDDDLKKANVAAIDKGVVQRLYFEGTCSFLRKMSTPTRNAIKAGLLKADEVLWYCATAGYKKCDDTAYWLAAPPMFYRPNFDPAKGTNFAKCGSKLKVCRNTKCVEATLLDKSDKGVWEGSDALLDVLEIPHGMHSSNTWGFGEGNVTVWSPDETEIGEQVASLTFGSGDEIPGAAVSSEP